MPTAKRERKREGKLARQMAELEAQRRELRRRRVIRLALPAAFLIGALLFVALSQGGDDDGDEAETPPADTAAGECPAPKQRSFPNPPEPKIDPAKTYTAAVTTNKGAFTVALDPKRAPKTVNSFVFLAREKYYDGVVFHRIIPGFVVQGGDPTGSGSGGPGYQFEDELPQAGEYKIGSVAMANSGPNTNGSQFFVITGDQGVQLPPNYSLFGQVTEGMETVKKLEAVGSQAGTPSEKVCMRSVTITET